MTKENKNQLKIYDKTIEDLKDALETIKLRRKALIEDSKKKEKKTGMKTRMRYNDYCCWVTCDMDEDYRVEVCISPTATYIHESIKGEWDRIYKQDLKKGGKK